MWIYTKLLLFALAIFSTLCACHGEEQGYPNATSIECDAPENTVITSAFYNTTDPPGCNATTCKVKNTTTGAVCKVVDVSNQCRQQVTMEHVLHAYNNCMERLETCELNQLSLDLKYKCLEGFVADPCTLQSGKGKNFSLVPVWPKAGGSCMCRLTSSSNQIFSINVINVFSARHVRWLPQLKVHSVSGKTLIPGNHRPFPEQFEIEGEELVFEFINFNRNSGARQRLSVEAKKEFSISCPGEPLYSDPQNPDSPEPKDTKCNDESHDCSVSVFLVVGFISGVIVCGAVVGAVIFSMKRRNRLTRSRKNNVNPSLLTTSFIRRILSSRQQQQQHRRRASTAEGGEGAGGRERYHADNDNEVNETYEVSQGEEASAGNIQFYNEHTDDFYSESEYDSRTTSEYMWGGGIYNEVDDDALSSLTPRATLDGRQRSTAHPAHLPDFLMRRVMAIRQLQQQQQQQQQQQAPMVVARGRTTAGESHNEANDDTDISQGEEASDGNIKFYNDNDDEDDEDLYCDAMSPRCGLQPSRASTGDHSHGPAGMTSLDTTDRNLPGDYLHPSQLR